MAVSIGPSERSRQQGGLGIASGQDGDGHVLALEGELELATLPALELALQRAEAGDCSRVVVDLRRLDFLDSSGIHLLLCARDRCADLGREFELVLEPGPVQRVLEVCGALAILTSQNQGAIAA
jgi:anti-anti-sigma factor